MFKERFTALCLVQGLAFVLPQLAAADPYVIPGIGPSAMPSAPIRQPVPPRSEARGNYGGGFIEMLMGGGTASRQTYAALPSPPAAPPPAAWRAIARSPDQASLPPSGGAPVQAAMDPMYARQEVEYHGPRAPGTLVIDTPNKFLFLIQPHGRALRYGIGVGRPGFEWSGVKTISRKSEWPDWTPPPEMIKRRPDLPSHMDGGPANPLGARALYLGSSLYRIHGTNEPYTIGKNVSSGCIRMLNDDVVDLYGRVGVGTKVIIM